MSNANKKLVGRLRIKREAIFFFCFQEKERYLGHSSMELNARDGTSRHAWVVLESSHDVDNVRVGTVALRSKDDRESVFAVDGESLLGVSTVAGGRSVSESWGRCRSRRGRSHTASKKVQNIVVGAWWGRSGRGSNASKETADAGC